MDSTVCAVLVSFCNLRRYNHTNREQNSVNLANFVAEAHACVQKWNHKETATQIKPICASRPSVLTVTTCWFVTLLASRKIDLKS